MNIESRIVRLEEYAKAQQAAKPFEPSPEAKELIDCYIATAQEKGCSAAELAAEDLGMNGAEFKAWINEGAARVGY